MAKASISLDDIPLPLLQWVEKSTPLPPRLYQARTFYEAARAANAVVWSRPLDHFAALNTWATIALIGDPRTRRYMAQLITDELTGLRWIIDTGHAVRRAMDELGRDATTPPKRQFEQRRTAAVKALRAARENLAALDIDPSLRDLLTRPNQEAFRRCVESFTRRNMRRGQVAAQKARAQLPANTSDGTAFAASFVAFGIAVCDTPNFADLLSQAEKYVAGVPTPRTDRHGARAQYLRALFTALRFSTIRARRVAFLAYASEAIFGERIETRDVRKLVRDLIEEEKRSDAEYRQLEEIFAEAGYS
ncbi:MAG: hypothetical protein J0H15_03995 [Xanthomonadales bacterium]|nr:hypothetical protein [Xanthomonadales bacterium]